MPATKTPAKPAAKGMAATRAGARAAATKKAATAKAAPKAKVDPKAKAAAAKAATGIRDQVRAAFEKGTTRRELREKFGLSYPQIYNMTKDLASQEHGRDRIVIDDPDHKGQKISRKAAMQRDFKAGVSVGDIGRKYGVIYQVAYQATKAALGDE